VLGDVSFALRNVAAMVSGAKCAKWCRNPCDYQKQKHIHREVLSIRESVQEFRHFDIVVVKTDKQLGDCLTKALPPQLHRAAVKTIFKV